MKQYDNSLQVPYGKPHSIPFKDAEKKTPDRMQNAWSMVGIAVAAGLAGWFAGVLIVLGLRSLLDLEIRVGVAALIGGVTMYVFLLIGLWKIIKDTKLITTVETITGHDWNRDGVVGPQQVTEITLQNGRGSWKKWRLPWAPEVVYEWGEAYLNGGSRAYDTWKNRFESRPGANDGEEQYREFRKFLQARGLAKEQGTHSVMLLDEGLDLFEAWVEEGIDAPTPLLASGHQNRLPG